jgi:hypothetical protein
MSKQKPTIKSSQEIPVEELIRARIGGGLKGTDIFPTQDHLINTKHWCHFCIWRDQDQCRAQKAVISDSAISSCKITGGLRTFPTGFPQGERHYKRSRREVDGDDGDNPSYPDHPIW